ncbi:hypothetical protein L1887_22928 [Cichorium endivia]|nr:hypothetical protein L1887_22928 [Cichorium endivia]
MAASFIPFIIGFLYVLSSAADAAIQYHDFVVQETPVKHGILQLGTPWANGPDRITQWLRATVYGALVIHPKFGSSYPFPVPKLEIPILLGQWWNGDIISILNQATFSGGASNVSNAYTINGQPGDLYRCSRNDTMRFYVESGDRILPRVINSTLNQQLFFTIGNHKLTVVGVDALYVKPFTTTTIMLGHGQTTDVILVADQAPGYYYMAACAYESAQNAPFDGSTTTTILALPDYNDSATVTAFTSQLKSPSKVEVPTFITEDLFFAIGLGLVNCNPGPTCQGPNNTRFAASMNNVSFVLPQTISLLQAHYQNIPNVFTTDFPHVPPLPFDYTSIRFVANNPGVWLMHCHIDSHLTWGFAMSFLVENEPRKLESIEAPPLDLPPC